MCTQHCNLLFTLQARGALARESQLSVSITKQLEPGAEMQNENAALKWFGEEGKEGLVLRVTDRLSGTLVKMCNDRLLADPPEEMCPADLTAAVPEQL